MDLNKFHKMNRDERLAHFTRVREQRARDAPAVIDPLAQTRMRIQAQQILKEYAPMKKTIAGKADFAANSNSAVALAAKLDAIRMAFKPQAEAIIHQFDPALAAMSQTARDSAKGGFDAKINKELAELRRDTEEARRAILEDLRMAKKQADEFGPHFGAPRTVASMYGLGSNDKQLFINQLADMGPAQVRSAALQAKLLLANPETAHQGKLLASAVLFKNQSMDKAYRPVNADEFAAECFASETADVANWVNGINESLARAEAAEREITGAGTTPLQRTKLGLTFPGKRIVPNDIEPEGSNDGVTALDKISAGLKANA